MKMPLFFSRFVFFILSSCLLTIIAAIPVMETSTLIPQNHHTVIKSTEMPLNTNMSNILKEDVQPFNSNLSNNEKISGKNFGKEIYQSCKFSNNTYQHKEQVPRNDPCEMCVCVDSEIYCFWKLCDLFISATSTTASSSESEISFKTNKQSTEDNKIVMENKKLKNLKTNEIEAKNQKFSKMLTRERKNNVLKKLEVTTPKNEDAVGKTTTPRSETSTMEPTVCYVMGVMYKYGEILPRDTGTCLECSCSEGGRVTCSPKDCVSQPDLDYLSHNNNLDMFDIDTF